MNDEYRMDRNKRTTEAVNRMITRSPGSYEAKYIHDAFPNPGEIKTPITGVTHDSIPSKEGEGIPRSGKSMEGIERSTYPGSYSGYTGGNYSSADGNQ